MENAARTLSLICLLALILLPKEYIQIFKKSEVQIIVATIVIIILLLYDAFAGLVLGVALIVVYVRLYSTMIPYKVRDNGIDVPDEVRNKGPMACLIGKYITEEHLSSAQTNTVDDSQLDTQIIGIPALDREQVFGAQGIYQKITGVDHISSSFASAQFK